MLSVSVIIFLNIWSAILMTLN